MILEHQVMRDKDGKILKEKWSFYDTDTGKREYFDKEKDVKAHVEKKGIKWSSFKRDKS